MKNLTGSILGLAGLWALAVAQPLLDALRRAPEFFVAHRADAIDAMVVAAALTLSGSILCVAILVVARAFNRKLVEPVTAGLVGAMTAILAVQIAYRTGVTGWPATLAVVAGAGGLAALAWLRMTVFRTYLAVLSPAAFIVPLVFFLGGPWRSGTSEQSGQTAAASARGVPVVVMVFDELSLVSLLDDTGKLNAVRFPNLAALAADGVWFRDATAVSGNTQSALPAILTGRYPVPRANPTLADHPNTLFSLVGPNYRFEVVEAATSLCPYELCSNTGPPRLQRQAAMAADIVVVAGHTFLPPDSRESLPDLTQNWAGFAGVDDDAGDATDDEASTETSGPRVIRAKRSWRTRWHRANDADHEGAFEAFISGISPEDRQPTLYFIHTMATHQPARWMPSGQLIPSRVGIPGQVKDKWTTVEWLVAQHHHSDIMQAMLADTLVGKVRARLTDAGIYDSSLVIVTADHGISFIPGDNPRNFSGTNAAEILSVPLIVKAPASTPDVVRGTIDDTNAETIDVLPTVAHVLGINPTWRVDGRSLIGGDPPHPQKQFFINAATMHETYGPDELRPIRDQLAKRQAEIFGLGKWPVFGVPGLLALAGRSVESFGNIRGIDSVRVVVEGGDGLLNLNPKARNLPAQLMGRFEQGDAGDAARHVLAVALNGTIVATTRAWPRSQRWMVMLPPDGLRAGRNDIEVFVVEPSGGLLRPRQ